MQRLVWLAVVALAALGLWLISSGTAPSSPAVPTASEPAPADAAPGEPPAARVRDDADERAATTTSEPSANAAEAPDGDRARPAEEPDSALADRDPTARRTAFF